MSLSKTNKERINLSNPIWVLITTLVIVLLPAFILKRLPTEDGPAHLYTAWILKNKVLPLCFEVDNFTVHSLLPRLLSWIPESVSPVMQELWVSYGILIGTLLLSWKIVKRRGNYVLFPLVAIVLVNIIWVRGFWAFQLSLIWPLLACWVWNSSFNRIAQMGICALLLWMTLWTHPGGLLLWLGLAWIDGHERFSVKQMAVSGVLVVLLIFWYLNSLGNISPQLFFQRWMDLLEGYPLSIHKDGVRWLMTAVMVGVFLIGIENGTYYKNRKGRMIILVLVALFVLMIPSRIGTASFFWERFWIVFLLAIIFSSNVSNRSIWVAGIICLSLINVRRIYVWKDVVKERNQFEESLEPEWEIGGLNYKTEYPEGLHPHGGIMRYWPFVHAESLLAMENNWMLWGHYQFYEPYFSVHIKPTCDPAFGGYVYPLRYGGDKKENGLQLGPNLYLDSLPWKESIK